MNEIKYSWCIKPTQNNFNGLTTIIQYARNSPSHDYIHAHLDGVSQATRPPVLEPFFNAIGHLNVLCDLLASHHDQGSAAKLPISFVFDYLPQIRDHLSYAAKAFGLLIANFPEITKSFRYFKQFEAFVQRCAIPLACLRSIIQSSEAASIQQDLVLYYLSANHDWLDTAESFLDTARPELECFLQIVSSRWIERLEDQDSIVSMQLMTLSEEIRRHCHPTFRHLHFDCFFFKDHLGNQVPIPLVFCDSWTELDTIIRRLCAGLDGAEYIMNDLWELVCANDTQVVDRNSVTVSQAILPELVYEITSSYSC
ncbi:hypothetical protein ONZ45_g12461 [Pleurotus djamor]|nr:hypothetical protein ONZ45_g12461 [Pleurotus djamor]